MAWERGSADDMDEQRDPQSQDPAAIVWEDRKRDKDG
jgi:hypothetical protein